MNTFLSTQAVAAYFAELYQLKGRELDNEKILKMHNDTGQSLDFPFQTIADQFRMIESHMQPLIIPFDVEVENLISSLHHTDYIGGLLRKLQPYTVQIPKKPSLLYTKQDVSNRLTRKTSANSFIR